MQAAILNQRIANQINQSKCCWTEPHCTNIPANTSQVSVPETVTLQVSVGDWCQWHPAHV